MRITQQRSSIDPAQIAARAEKLKATLEGLRSQLAQQPKTVCATPVATPRVQIIDRNPDRPQSLDDMIGQTEIMLQLRLCIAGSQLRNVPLGNVLVSGAPGLGKSSIAQVISAELDIPMIATTGQVLRKVDDVVNLLMGIDGPTVLFVDEAQGLNKSCAEVLLIAMEDHFVDTLGAAGNGTVATRKQLPGLVVVLATTHPGKLTQAMRDRCSTELIMSEYSDEEIAQIIQRYWKSRKMQFFKGEDLELARRSRGIPRVALGLAGRVLDLVAVNGQSAITSGTVAQACAIFRIDAMGLNDVDRKILAALTGPYRSKPIGLDNLAAFLNMEPSTIEANEGFLVRSGFVTRTGRGRAATAAAYDFMREAS
jgi:Holliday junction DNA helicase RuvB